MYRGGGRLRCVVALSRARRQLKAHLGRRIGTAIHCALGPQPRRPALSVRCGSGGSDGSRPSVVNYQPFLFLIFIKMKIINPFLGCRLRCIWCAWLAASWRRRRRTTFEMHKHVLDCARFLLGMCKHMDQMHVKVWTGKMLAR